MRLFAVHREFINAIREYQADFRLNLSDKKIEQLADYYEIVQKHNPRLHLVAPCPPEEFAVRHILESLTLLEYLPKNASFADVGAGAGLPSIPCLIVRDDLSAMLIESKKKKAVFLQNAIDELGLAERAEIVNRQFEETEIGECGFVTCRALDRFSTKLSRLRKWSGGRRMLLFGGPSLGEKLKSHRVPVSSVLTPLSTQRFLYVSDRS